MSRILLLLDHRENRRLLADALAPHHELIVPDSDSALNEDFGLGIVDGRALDRLQQQVQARKQAEQPAILPFLLVTSRQDVGMATRHLWTSIDDLIISPIEKVELLARVNSLINTRQLSQEFNRIIIQSSPLAIIVVDRSDRIRQWNPAAVQRFGLSQTEALGRLLSDALGGTADELHQALNRALRGERLIGIEAHHKKPGGTFGDVIIATAPLRDSNGLITHAIAMVDDVTERKAAEAALRESEAHFRRLAQNAADIIYRYRLAPPRGFEYVSPAATPITGYTPEEHYADPELIFTLVHPDDRPLLAATSTGANPSWQPLVLRWLRKDATVIWIEQRNVPIYDEAGRLVALEGIARDITESKRREREIEIVSTVSTALRVAATRVEMLPVILDNLLVLLQVECSALEMWDPEHGTLQIELARGGWAPLTGTPVSLGTTLSMQLLTDGGPYLNNTAQNDPRLLRSVALGAECAVAAVLLMAQGKPLGLLWIGSRRTLAERDIRMLTAIADIAANAIHRVTLYEQTEQDALELAQAYDSTIEGWSGALDLRDKETEGHTLRVTEMTLRLARAAGIPESAMVHIRRGALLHDIGKMGVPDAILLKPDKLTEAEWVIMRQHPVYAYNLLAPIAYLHPALDIPYCHHEKWDGSGYPRGLKGEQIPLAARLFAVVDVWDALRSDRPYRRGWPEAKVREHILALAGTHFDPKAVEIFIQVLDAELSDTHAPVA